MKSTPTLSMLIASSLLMGCSALTKPSTERLQAPRVAPLVVASCPRLNPLVGDTMGELAQKLVEVAEIYYTCVKSIGLDVGK